MCSCVAGPETREAMGWSRQGTLVGMHEPSRKAFALISTLRNVWLQADYLDA